MAVLGLHFCARAFSSCGKRGPLFIAVHGPLTIAASLVAEHRLQTRRLSNCGSRAQLLQIMLDLPRPGLEPVSPALAGRFSTTAPPGKPQSFSLMFSTLFEFLRSSSFPWYPKNIPYVVVSGFSFLPFTLNFNLPGVDMSALFLKESSSSSSNACGEKMPLHPLFPSPFTHSPHLGLRSHLWRL